MKNKSTLVFPLSMMLILVAVSLCIAGILAVLPPIPRIVTAMNRPISNKLSDSLTVKCGPFDVISSARIHAHQWGVCPGRNVESKIRWDYGMSGSIVAVTSSKQTDGDQRDLERNVGRWQCDRPNG